MRRNVLIIMVIALAGAALGQWTGATPKGDFSELQIGGTTVITSGRVLQNATANASVITAGTLSTDRYSAAADLAAELTPSVDQTIKWSGTAWVATGFPAAGNYANLITVAKSGGDYTTIQAAVDAATTGTTVLVFPGVYEEKVAINKAISLVGTDKNNCVIKHNKDGREDAVVMVRAFMSGFAEIKDLTLWNTGESYSTALRVERPARISNCVMIGNHADTVILKCLYSKHSIYVDNCYITGYYDSLTFASNAGHAWASNCIIVSEGCSPVWVGTKDCNAHINDCDLIVQREDGGAGINIGDDVGKSINMFLSNIRCYKPARTAIPLFRIYNGTGTTAYVSNCEYSEIGNSNVSIVYTKTSAINADGNSVFGGSINAGSLKIGGTETVSSSRAVSAVGLSNSETRWKDWAAVAACGAAVVWDGNRGRNVGWSPGYGDEAGCYFYNYLLSDDDGQRVYFPIPYEAGTILTRLRVKWCANAQDNGIKVRLVKRDETAYNDAWTVVGAQQSYIDSAGDLNININTYDFADETMQANHSYAIEVESVVDNPDGVRLYSFGIETSKRVY